MHNIVCTSAHAQKALWMSSFIRGCRWTDLRAVCKKFFSLPYIAVWTFSKSNLIGFLTFCLVYLLLNEYFPLARIAQRVLLWPNSVHRPSARGCFKRLLFMNHSKHFEIILHDVKSVTKNAQTVLFSCTIWPPKIKIETNFQQRLCINYCIDLKIFYRNVFCVTFHQTDSNGSTRLNNMAAKTKNWKHFFY